MANTVIGFFENGAAAERAALELVRQGYSHDNIDIARPGAANAENTTENEPHENGITRFFKSLFGDNAEAERYSQVGNSGTSIVTVHTQTAEEARHAADLLDELGALDVDNHAASKELYYDFDQSTSVQSSQNDENVRPGKRDSKDFNERTEKSESRHLRSRIVEKPVTDDARLRDDWVRNEENPVDRIGGEKNLQPFQEGTIELTERKEMPIVNKEARVVEEISIRKEVSEKNETLHETVRATDIAVERIDSRDKKKTGINDVEDNSRYSDERASKPGNRNDARDDNRKENRDPLFGA